MKNDYSLFEDLRRSLWKPDELILMLLAYFDESGTHKDSKVLSFGGYISTTKKWRKFDKHWQAMLKAEGLSMMHWTDLESRHGHFKGWPAKRKLRVQKQAISIIGDNVLHGFSGAVVVDHYDEFFKTRPHLKPSSPYVFTMVATLTLMKVWIKENSIKQPIHYFYESGAGHSAEMSEVMNATDEIGWDYYRMKSVKSWSFADKKDFLPLQSADILAYETYKQLVNTLAGDVRRDLRKSAESLLRTVPHYSHYLDKGGLVKLHTHLGMD